MYKLSVPIMFYTFNEENKYEIVKNLREAEVQRVFLCGQGYLFNPGGKFYSDEMKEKVDFLRSEGFEVGIWFNSFGHGDVLMHESGGKEDLSMFTKTEGIGGINENSVCPYDENVINAVAKNIKLVAKLGPDLMMFDDDYRLNYRGGCRMGCMCKNHLDEYFKRIGEVLTKEEIERKVFSGGKNFYRDEWLKLQGESLVNFAKRMREAVNEVSPEIRMSICSCWDTWDFEGTDCIKIAEALAGDTAPFLRTIGAAYHNTKVSTAVEANRAQAFWCKGKDIELFTEGDVYPRPRYNVSSRQLELFDLALLSSGEFDGILKYMYDYTQPFGYETGYTDRHIRNKNVRSEIKEAIRDKKSVGIRVIDIMAKTENWHLPENTPEGISSYLCSQMENSRNAKCILTDNAVPTTYSDEEAPIFIMGENAWYIEENDLANGALIDISAAKILTERGFDVGLINAEPHNFTGEYYVKEKDTIYNFGDMELFKVKVSEKAEVETYLIPLKTPGTYRYENGKGQRFFVISASLMGEKFVSAAKNENYTSNYYRKKELCEAIEYISGRKMAVKTYSKCPDLYMTALENEDKTSLFASVINPFIDDAQNVEFYLGKKYENIKFIGCEGTFDGEKVTVNYIEPFGFAGFEVTM